MIDRKETHVDRRMRLVHEEKTGLTLFDPESSTCQTREGEELECEMSRFVQGLFERYVSEGYSSEEIFVIITGPLYFWVDVFERGAKEKQNSDS